MKIIVIWKCYGMLCSGILDMYICIVYEINNVVVLYGIFYRVFVEKICCEIIVRFLSDVVKGRVRWIF